MSTQNYESLTPKQGEFFPHEHPEQVHQHHPHGGHQPGRKVGGNDDVPVSHAQTFPPGTAPASSSYSPNPYDTVPGQAMNPSVERAHGKESTGTSAGDTLMGATSKDVNRGLGQPASGQTSAELHHDGQHGRKHHGSGLEGVGANKPDRFERTMPSQRGYERDEAQGGQHGDKGFLGAEDKFPESAESITHEWKYEPSTKHTDRRHGHA
ncbi:hypothetical protein BDW42DRAFT_158288 [Aspergillus taichungensis]|uniref:Uncharacterized protein n=1 Tax=Aspergillus taichungensis TaxID=482145 RepID=A0A2J5I9F1_9EURO|nr:hypothetical protein BDW42DRAFT_158288 [Aspergillus taichungensis]